MLGLSDAPQQNENFGPPGRGPILCGGAKFGMVD
jgi:hypothetical protein